MRVLRLIGDRRAPWRTFLNVNDGRSRRCARGPAGTIRSAASLHGAAKIGCGSGCAGGLSRFCTDRPSCHAARGHQEGRAPPKGASTTAPGWYLPRQLATAIKPVISKGLYIRDDINHPLSYC